MKNAQGKRSHLARLAVIAAVVLVAVAVLAGPALAAPPHDTGLSAQANDQRLNFGRGTLISAVLMDITADVALDGQSVRVEQSTAGASGPWQLLYIVTTPSTGPYTSGTYSGPVLPQQNTWYQFAFEATAGYTASRSDKLAIQVRPLVGTPRCPAKIKHGKRFTVKGTLKPAFPMGAKTVKVKAFKMNNKRKWVALKTTYTARNYDYKGYTQYRVRIKFSKKGTYRFRAQTKGTLEWLAAASAYSRVLKVK